MEHAEFSATTRLLSEYTGLNLYRGFNSLSPLYFNGLRTKT